MTRHISAGEEDGRLLFLFTRLFWDARGGDGGASARALLVTDALLKDEASARALYAYVSYRTRDD